MKNTKELPENYREIYALDLQKDKKTALIVNGISVALTVVTFIIGTLIVPFSDLFDFDAYDPLTIFLRYGVMFVGMFAYIILHEAVHGICMKRFIDTKINYGFTGLYAYAGCDAYFCKSSYIIIALAPIIVWGVVLLLLNIFLPASWFWVVYFIQIINISGAAGDIYVTYKFSKLPKDILVRDTGVAMTVYSTDLNRSDV